MAFWTEAATREPLRQNRWYMYFGNPTESSGSEKQLNNYIFSLKECSKPEYKIETSSHVLINHTFNYPKNVVWQPITVKMVSIEDNAYILKKILNDCGYKNPRQKQDKQISKKSLTFEKIELIQVDENGAKAEVWNLINPFIININFGSLSYDSENFVDITFGVIYDYAELQGT